MTSPALDPPRPTLPDPAEPLAVVQRARKRRPYAIGVLLGITALAALARFPNLDKPTLWYAEVQGVLNDDGRVLSPFVIRLVPAIAGTLLVPAVYFLAATILPRPTALVAAAFVALSGWALTFSREAQPHTLLWLSATAALAAVHVLLRRRTAGLLIVLDLIILLAAAAWFRIKTSPLNEPGAVRGPIAFLTGLVIPTESERVYVPGFALRWMTIGVILMLLPLALGLIPWPRRGPEGAREPKIAFDPEATGPPRWLPATLLAAWVLVAYGFGRPSFMTPAVGIIAAVLLVRIPFAPMRWLYVALVCFLNFLAAAAPVAGQVEPPIDQIAHDVWQARDFAGPSRTFVQFRDATPDRGGGTIFNDVGKYYLAVEARGREPVPPVNPITGRKQIVDDVTGSPQLDRLIVWDYFSQAAKPPLPPRPLEEDLPPGWKLISEGHRAVWGQGWQYRYTARRREYVKSPPMDAEPAAN